MAKQWMVDTNILVDYLRNRQPAVDYMEGQAISPRMSAVVTAELYAGVRDGRERQMLDKLMHSFEIVPVSREIATQAGLYCREYRPSHGVLLPDALIAATAASEQMPLATLNKKHFPMLENVLVPYEI